MAAEAATFSPHLADSLLEAHVRPVLLPALSSGARVLEQELLRLRLEALAMADGSATEERDEQHACIWLSDEVNGELTRRRRDTSDEVSEMLETAAMEMMMLSDVSAAF